MAPDTEMTIWEHLDELRSRLIWTVGALVVGTAVSVAFTTWFLQILIAPMGSAMPQTIAPTENFVVFFRVALIGGVTIAMPMIVYQVVRFILPGLLPEERKYLYFLLPGVAVCFAGGVAFASLIMLPAAITFMQSFLNTIAQSNWTLDNYISFVTRVLFWMGIVFQTPLLLFFLSKLGIVSAQKLAQSRKWAVLAIAIIAAMVTPTPDPVNMMIVMIPLYLLYEVGIILARIGGRGVAPRALRLGGSADKSAKDGDH
jgi:sec-independent protein translocase protein TatC